MCYTHLISSIYQLHWYFAWKTGHFFYACCGDIFSLGWPQEKCQEVHFDYYAVFMIFSPQDLDFFLFLTLKKFLEEKERKKETRCESEALNATPLTIRSTPQPKYALWQGIKPSPFNEHWLGPTLSFL